MKGEISGSEDLHVDGSVEGLVSLEDRKLTPISAESEYIPLAPVELPEAQANEVLQLVDKLEQDEDVQKVFHNLA